MKASMIIWEYQKLNIKADAGNGDKAIRTVGVIVNDSGFKKGEPIPPNGDSDRLKHTKKAYKVLKKNK